MQPIRVYHATTSELQATVTTDGSPATGATVTVSITYEGSAVVTDASMTHDGSGVYVYTIANTLLTNLGELYDVEIVAVDGSNTSTYTRKLKTVEQNN